MLSNLRIHYLHYDFYIGVKKDVSTDEAFDFRTAKKIGQDIVVAGGYDHNYCFDEVNSEIRARSTFFQTFKIFFTLFITNKEFQYSVQKKFHKCCYHIY